MDLIQHVLIQNCGTLPVSYDFVVAYGIIFTVFSVCSLV